jgi:PsbP-like protein
MYLDISVLHLSYSLCLTCKLQKLGLKLVKSFFVVIAFVTLLSVIGNSNVLAVYAQSLLTYSNIDAGFKIQYPSDWKKIEPARVSQLEPINLIVSFIAPKHDNKTSGIVIYTEDLAGKNMTIKQYVREKYNELTQDQQTTRNEPNVEQINRQAIAQMGVEDALKLPVDERKSTSDYASTLLGTPTYKIINDAPTKVGGLPAWKIQYSAATGKYGLPLIDAIDVFVLKNEQAYVISYFGSDGQYSSLLPVAQKIIDSFQISG